MTNLRIDSKSLHPTLEVPVAIKVLPTDVAIDEDLQQRFVREAKIATQLSHPNIVRVFEYGEQDSQKYIVMEFIEGKDVSHWINANGKFSLQVALPILQQIASALDYAHSQGVIHRDIKPSNILLDSSQRNVRAVLTDFGIAKFLNAKTVMTHTGYMLGTFDYISPEQIQESSHVEGKADIYSLGVMTYQMLTGELPFKQARPGAILMAHMTQPPPAANDSCAEIPANIAHAIQKAMAKRPEDRFDTASSFISEFSLK